MLARIASTLYWTGRYIERSEHLARYLRVQYFSMLDAPMGQSKQFILQSIINMYEGKFDQEKQLVEAEVLQQVGMDYSTPNSIRSTVRMARENASSVRHVISTELWEAINQFYIYCDKTDPEEFAIRGLYEYTTQVGRHCAIIRSRIHDTLLHDQAWLFVKLGIHLERAAQVIRIVNSKLYDIDEISKRIGPNDSEVLKQYQQTVLLKVVEGFDMHRRANQRSQSMETALKFVIGHPHFSRSITYNIQRLRNTLKDLSVHPDALETIIFRAGKLHSYFHYLEYDDPELNMAATLNEGLEKIYALHQDIERLFFNTVSTPIQYQQQSQN